MRLCPFEKTLMSCLLLLLVAVILPQSATAHDARPVVVAITEQLPGAFQFLVRVPDTVELSNQPGVAWPQDCTEQNATAAPGSLVGVVVCEDGLAGKALALDFPFFNPSLATFYRLTTLDGDTRTAMRTPTQGPWQVPAEPTAGNVAKQYLALGVEHILGGLDHLLFVLGLLVIARTFKRILWTVTGFTIAHSITLSLSALGLVSIPIVPVEAVIALSILFLAHEISSADRQTLAWRYPLLVSFGFGLLHGLGFASALGEIGLVQSEILVSLLFFNLGVEVGQVGFILVIIAAVWLLGKVFSQRFSLSETLVARRVDLLTAYIIGIPSAYWLIDRIAGM